MTAPRFRAAAAAAPQPWPLALGGADRGLVIGAEGAATAAVDAVLEACQRGEPAVLVEAPAGAGKTHLVRDLAALEVADAQGRVLVACATQAQATEVAWRLAERYRSVGTALFVRRTRPLPDAVRQHPRLRLVHRVPDLPTGPSVVVANVAKLRESALRPGAFDALIVDEAFQVPDFRFLPVAALAERCRLVGDPSQIEPVVAADVQRWADDPAGAHVQAPHALRARLPGLVTMQLPVSRRLPRDTVTLVREALYPGHPFIGCFGPETRALDLTRPALHHPLDRVLDPFCAGASLLALELPAVARPRPGDIALAETIVSVLQRLAERGAVVVTSEGVTPLTPDRIAVACPHVEQVGLVQQRLPDAWRGHVLVETCNRLQGLERPFVVAWHPLAGRSNPSPFGLNPGRLCVALSRHQVACLLVQRAGLEATLDRADPGDVEAGSLRDSTFAGLTAHRLLLDTLRRHDRVVALA